MRVCVDVSAAVHHRGGIGRYTQELVAALAAIPSEHTCTAFFNRSSEALPDLPLASLPRLSVPWDDKPWRLRVLLAHLLRRPQDGLFPGIDLFHGADHLMPYLGGTSRVFTLYDLTYLTARQTHAALNRLYLTLMVPRFLRAAHAVIVISESTRRDALAQYRVDPRKLHVVHGGVSGRFAPASPDATAAVRRSYDLPPQFILAVGTIEPRKNYETLLDAYRALRDRGQNAGLVIAGREGWRSEGFHARLRELGLQGEVRLLGFVSEADLPALYTAAAAFAFPSLYEGFGLPVIEAMACGAPVVAGNTSSLPEVVGTAGLLVAPHDAAGLAAAIEALLTDPVLASDLRARGLAQAQRFTWEAAARATMRVYETALATGGTR